MFIKAIKISKKLAIFVIICIFLITSVILFYSFANDNSEDIETKKDFIKWVDFNVTSDILSKTAKLDIDSHNKNSDIKYNWIELLAYLACKNGGNFKNYKQKDLDKLLEELENGKNIEDLTKNMKYYSYYYESYSAILSEFIGNYSIETVSEDGTKKLQEKYGLKAFLPIAKNYGFSHYDDF